VDDAELVIRAQAGEVTAYEELVRRHSAAAIRLAHAICGSSGDAEDAAQDAFVKAYQTLGRFRADAPVRPWLLRIVANEAKNRRRSAGRRGRLATLMAGRRPDHQATPEDAAISDADTRAVLTALSALPERDRDVVSCRYFGGLSERETAAVLGCREGTVRSRLARALERLRVALGDAVGLEVADG
jgi:RNA polymerase sigma-70 factor (ECF subfamily)